MANESEVRQKAQSQGLSQAQQDKAVEIARNNPNYSADQVVDQARNQ